MNYYFHESAALEFEKAVDYYEDCRYGLGLEFADEVYAAIERIILYPESWALVSKNARRCLVNRFPFGIIYQIEKSYLYIIAVADLRRRPGYWISRK
ncbi:MAG: type II toxin-antitoxin system RelE/ParE family toxin [Desulfobacteraceae bacterium]|nr:type II toxin-antitoxin system RelE/ParE family toxin [Desulfobacteraceae bacterium]